MHELIEDVSQSVPVQRLCSLARVPRCTYYRAQRSANVEALLDPACVEVHHICDEFPRYGYRRVTKELQRRGHRCNHKRILALMRTEKLLCRPKKRFIRTTNSRHGLRVYPNVVPTMTVTQTNQLWVADLTYIRLVRGVAYLAIILDGWSRRAIGWAIDTHIDAALSLRALRMALATRRITPGLVHHSDRGVQYACHDYVGLLQLQNITISMSRTGNPYDNAMAESFMKTLKTEEVYLNEYENLDDAKHNIDRFIEIVYNSKRLHSSLGYQTPMEYEVRCNNTITQNSSTLTTPETVSR